MWCVMMTVDVDVLGLLVVGWESCECLFW